MKKVFYQPILSESEWEKTDLPSFGVYRQYENAKMDFPDSIIGAYTEDDIEEPTFVDDENDSTPTYYVDIPKSDSEEWENIESFKDRNEAIKFAQEKFGADEKGMVSLVTQ